MYSKTISALIIYLFIYLFIYIYFFFWGGGEGVGGRLFEAGRLLTFPTYSVGAYSRWALIRGWALNRINTVLYFRSREGRYFPSIGPGIVPNDPA